MPRSLQALLGALLALPGCVSITGPCELRVEEATRVLVCHPGGHVFLLPPSVLDKFTKEARHDAAPSSPAR